MRFLPASGTTIIIDTGLECRCGTTGLGTRACGSTIRPMGKAGSFMRTGICMRESGRRIRHTAREFMCILMGPGMKAPGKMTSNMDLELRHGPMGPGMKELIEVGRRRAGESSVGPTEACTRGSSLIIIYMGLGFTAGVMEGSSMENGNAIKWMGKEFSRGVMEDHILDSI